MRENYTRREKVWANRNRNKCRDKKRSEHELKYHKTEKEKQDNREKRKRGVRREGEAQHPKDREFEVTISTRMRAAACDQLH